jgi:uncharacterized membrane protein YjgN (DUF898 family)
MTSIEAIGPSEPPAAMLAAAPSAAAPGVAGARFVGPADKFWTLLVRGAALLMVTLGIYRFWLTTDIRRYLWANTEIAGDALEYLGTGRELLIGFLIAIAILVPVYVGFFIALLDAGPISQWAGIASFVLLAVIGQFAIYRARRYRLTRTMFRGLRFHQTGSGWRYALYAVTWWVVSALTLGLAYPWGQASLERYKMRNTYYGDLQGRFGASGTRLFVRGFLLWVVTVVPLLAAIIAPVVAIDWHSIPDMAKGGATDFGWFEGANPALAGAILFSGAAVVWTIVVGTLLYPAFQGIVLKWWLEGLRFGGITVKTRLRKRSVYGVYVRFLWHSIAFGAVLSILALVLGGALGGFAAFGSPAGNPFAKSSAAEIAGASLLVVGYVVAMLGFSTIFQATVRLGLWRLGFESAELHGLEALDEVKAVAQPTSALGEGLADALNVGGF